MSFQISWQSPSLMTVVYTGQTSDKEVLEVVKRQHGDERFDFLKMVLHDFSAIEGCSSDGDTLLELGARGAGAAFTNPHLKIAVVTERHDVIDMVDRFLKEGVSPYPMRIFATADMAADWLAH